MLSTARKKLEEIGKKVMRWRITAKETKWEIDQLKKVEKELLID